MAEVENRQNITRESDVLKHKRNKKWNVRSVVVKNKSSPLNVTTVFCGKRISVSVRLLWISVGVSDI